MTGIEIVILVAGILCICISFLMAGKREELSGQSVNSEPAEIWSDKEEEMIRNRVSSLLEEKQFETVEQAKDQMNHLCNDKIMAMDEFSRQILSKIDANHQEVVFMYNLLGEKENELKEMMAGNLTPDEESDTAVPEEPVSELQEEPDTELEKDALDEIFKEQWGSSGSSEEEPDREKINRQIKKMHEQGQSVLEISKALDMGQGEVKLVLDLYGGRK